MELLLIVPRYSLTNKKNYDYYFPIGLSYIASVIKKAGYNLDCLNLNHFDGAIDYLITQTLNKKEYDIVCSGDIGIGFASMEKIILTIRNHKSNPKFILGGAIITSAPKLIFKALNPDYAVIGEGEVTILELLKFIEQKKDLKKVDGIIYKDSKGEMIITAPRKPIEDLSKIPYPDFESLGFREYLENQSSQQSPHSSFDYPRSYPILCSRGCPFRCTFCYHCLGIKYRTRPIGDIMKELRWALKEYKINLIPLHDDLFSANKERLYEFCKEIKKLFKEIPWKCEWFCQISVQNVDREMLSILKDAGCTAISWGFESYSPIVLKSMKKPITPEQIDRAIKLSMEFKINIMGNFIFGDVAETKETAKETLDYWKKNCKGQVGIYFIQPYPGSEIYDYCVKKGIIKDELDYIKNKMAHLNWFNMTEKMSDEEMSQLKKEIFKLRREYCKYIVPKKITFERKPDVYTLVTQCPFCKEKVSYKNFRIRNFLIYTAIAYCRKCHRGFKICSRFYKFTMDYYNELEFFRRNFLLVRDSILKKRL